MGLALAYSSASALAMSHTVNGNLYRISHVELYQHERGGFCGLVSGCFTFPGASHAALVYCDRPDHAVIEKAPRKHLEIRVPSADNEGSRQRMIMIYWSSVLHDLM